jgi:dihydrofolate synthase/folylpolyglutamate synthase
MTYDEVLRGIHSRKTFSSRPTLDRIRRLLDALGNPQDQLRCIHIAGTNGKGSVSALVESALRRSGFRVGLFTSPYLVDFRERIQVDRQLISEESLTVCYETVMAAENALEQQGFEPVNEFELVTALGFTAFQAAKVDYAVMETGLGGRWDATNVIKTPAACCITPISLDHTAVLGDTLEQIAGEKAGIFKENCPVVLAPQAEAARQVLLRQAAEMHSPVTETKPGKLLQYDLRGITMEYDETVVHLPLLGEYQTDNAAAAWEVCKLLGLDKETIAQGFSQVSWPGRLQYIPGAPDLLIDAGHNPAGIQALCQALDQLFPDRDITCVMAMMQDKDYAQCIPLVARRCRTLIAATVGLPRSLPPADLAQVASPYCKTFTAETVLSGISRAKDLAGPKGLVLVCGSVYAAGEAQKIR